MDNNELTIYQEQLPGDWRVMRKVSEGPKMGSSTIEVARLFVESAKHNVVLEGSWKWILARAASYEMRGR